MGTYRYDDQVAWNRDLPALMARLRRVLAPLLGEGFGYIAAKEPQDRGVLHVHVIIRVEGPVKVPAGVVLQTAQGVTVEASGRTVGWGKQGHCHVVSSDPRSLAREVGYVVKGTGEDLAPVAVDFGSLWGQHVARLHEAAAAMTCGNGCRGS